MEKIEFKQMFYSLKSWILHPFYWGKWVDILTFSFGSSAYLLQGRVNSISNSKQFKLVQFKRLLQIADAPSVSLDRLKEVGLSK